MKHAFVLLLVLAASTIWANWEINEDFENGSTPAGWTVVDEDGDGFAWGVFDNASYAHSGSHLITCENYLPNENEDWLITPQLTVESGDSLHFWVRSWYSTENIEVLLSTDGTSLNDFDYTLAELEDIDDDYMLVSLPLEDYVGQAVYIAFYWECDTYSILVDDVKIGQEDVLPPGIELPDSFTFMEGQSLTVDFGDYITNATPATATLIADNNVGIEVDIDGFSVTFSATDWSGTENIVFVVSNDSGADMDDVNVNVTPIPVLDIVALDILAPVGTQYMNHDIVPGFIFANYGNLPTAQSFDIMCEVIDGTGATVFLVTEQYTATVQPEDEVTYTFSTAFTPDAEGDYVIMMTADYPDAYTANNMVEGTFDVVEHFGAGGPDDFGYTWLDSETEGGPEYNWIDNSGTGASAIMEGVGAFSGDDNFSEPIEFGFSFPFYGQSYTTFHADTNGELLLADNTWYTPYPDDGWNNDGNVFNWTYLIPGYTQMPALISVFWDDLEADEGVGDIYYQTFGTEPDRYCVVQWKDFRFHAGSTPETLLNFEVILHEDGEIVMQYESVATGQTGTQAPHDYGQSSTIAIQNEPATAGLTYLQEQVEGSVWVGVEPVGNLPRSGLAISFALTEDVLPPIMSHEPVGNTFNTGFTLAVTVLDASELADVVMHYNVTGEWTSMSYSEIGEDGEYLFHLTDVPPSTPFDYYFEAADVLGNSGTLPANAPDERYGFHILPTEGVEVLLACSGTQDYQHTEQPLYEEILQQMNVSYDVYDWQEYDSYQLPAQYKTIIAFANSGSASDASDTLSVALMEFLDAGTEEVPHNLFFASDGFAYTQGGYPNDEPMKMLLNAYFRTWYVGTALGGGTNGLGGPDQLLYTNGTIVGLDDSPVGNPGDELGVYANSPDCIFEIDECPSWYADMVQNPEIGSHNAFMFEDGPIDGQAYLYHGVCATWIDCLIYRAFYFSFDLSQLTSADDQRMFLEDALDWFETPVNSSEDEQAPAALTLVQNAPNPFNPETSIRFNLPENGPVDLAVYNIRGQRVATLLHGPLDAGQHTVVWHGQSDDGRPVGSGVYFFRLSCNGETRTRKALLLK